uniref:SPARK domain-containing protein n=1 Tax=Trichuris muris TaxID=70415 RepID=A0A5S6QQA9_TRIMR
MILLSSCIAFIYVFLAEKGSGQDDAPAGFRSISQQPPTHPFGRPSLSAGLEPVAPCPFTTMTWCNQDAWANLGLSIAGIVPKQKLCEKYVPEDSCIGQSLLHCSDMIDSTLRKMMIAFAQVVIAWCYDAGQRLSALNNNSACLSAAMVDVVTDKGCLSDIIPPPSLPRQHGSKNLLDGVRLFEMISNFIGSYQSSTVLCIYDVIKSECGESVAELTLGAAVEELLPKSKPLSTVRDQPTELTTTTFLPLPEANVTFISGNTLNVRRPGHVSLITSLSASDRCAHSSGAITAALLLVSIFEFYN